MVGVKVLLGIAVAGGVESKASLSTSEGLIVICSVSYS